MTKIYKLSAPTFDEKSIRRFLHDEGTSWIETESATPGERLAEFAGRLCYMSFGTRQFRTSNTEYIENLLRQGHESVIEHCNWTFLLVGVSRAFSHQLVRHRVGFSFSQLSQQYHDESEAQFIVPDAVANSPTALAKWQEAGNAAQSAYKAIRHEAEQQSENPTMDQRESIRRLRSDARSVLPNAIETKIAITANARAIRHFLELRGSNLGDVECRIVSSEIFLNVEPDAPSLFRDFRHFMHSDGYPVVEKINR